MSLWQRFKEHPIIDTCFHIKGNPRACLWTEPLWGIPYNLYVPFATVFMYSQGVNDAQIGFILSVGMVFQVFASLAGGVFTDKLGRRLTTIIFDCLSWSVPCLIWAAARNFWWFLAAQILNSMWQITNNSWTALLVEDCDPDKLVNIYAGIQITGLLAVFFAPISTFLVGRFSMETTVRGLYILSFVMMTAKFIILFCCGTETEQGKIRMAETKNVSWFSLFKGYGGVLRKILSSPQMVMVAIFMVLSNISNVTIGNFFGLYVTQKLGISEEFIPLFPMVRAVIMLLFYLFFQSFVGRFAFRPVIRVGFVAYILSHVALLLCPPGNLPAVFLYTLLEALGAVLVGPRKDSLAALFVDKQDRARVNALLYVIMSGVTSPFGWLIGLLSGINRMLPFFVNIGIFLLSMVIILSNRALKEYDREHLPG